MSTVSVHEALTRVALYEQHQARVARLERQVAQLLAALELVTDALNDHGIGDIAEWRRDRKAAIDNSRAVIAEVRRG